MSHELTLVGLAPSRSGHMYVEVACSCGAPKRVVRATLFRNGKVVCENARKGHTGNASHQPNTFDLQFNALQSSLDALQSDLSFLAARLDGLDEIRDLLKAQIVGQAQAYIPAQVHAKPTEGKGLKDYSLKPEPRSGTGERPHPPQPQQFAKPKHKHKASDLTRINALASLAFPERTPELKQELEDLLHALVEHMHMVPPGTPEYAPLFKANDFGRHAIREWHLDPDNLP